MRTAELSYELPHELIARYPAAERDAARLLVVEPERLHHECFAALETWLPERALVVVNDTRVLPARLLGKKETGGRAELLLVRCEGQGELRDGSRARPCELWRALARGAGRVGGDLWFGTALGARLLGRADDEGLCRVALFARDPGPAAQVGAADALRTIAALRAAEGHVPLPPYLGRGDEPIDRERYQTVFGRVPGAVAAPTAGLHFTETLCARLLARGIELARLTLHVGPGTFRPVSVDDLDDHPMHAEPFAVPEETAQAVARARARGAEVVAVGTTVVRALESAADPARPGHVCAGSGETKLLIQPGHRFTVVDGLVTNFHLPGSTLLALVYAFAGAERVRAAYRAAVAERYRFFSYGDAMYLRARASAGGTGSAAP
ncbi:MAG: tRNA preQ1(34) S-adenosylmethionine ribosyltransferase-isomerase QueA [Myxococcales bacterium]|nr:tRNA preQ1(34) S-adenosylmethionine ribosyltransferase-isomerase QueA [Myxococcales bacterium]